MTGIFEERTESPLASISRSLRNSLVIAGAAEDTIQRFLDALQLITITRPEKYLGYYVATVTKELSEEPEIQKYLGLLPVIWERALDYTYQLRKERNGNE